MRCIPQVSDPSIARANLGYAVYRGTLVGSVAQYLGIQYAKAPVDDLRFRRPVDPDAKRKGPYLSLDLRLKRRCLGPVCLGISEPYPNAEKDEDCLYANVWAPANTTVESKLPVWLFIQGGGYTLNSNANWNGTEVVQRSGHEIVFVNLNYRVGLWGFLASERVRADGDLNAGLLHQRFMLRWLRRHIAQFGGNPDHIAIHGASAGAGPVALHLVAHGGDATDPESGEKLFVGAFNLTLQRTGCDNNGDGNDEAMACLRSKSTEALQAANIPTPFPGRLASTVIFYEICRIFFSRKTTDGELLPNGSVRLEGTVFAANASRPGDMTAFLQSNYPLLSQSNASAIVKDYSLLDNLPNHNVWFPSTARAHGETTFICPAADILNSYVHHLNSSRAWGYRYDVHDENEIAAGLGVPHLVSSWAIFGPDSQPGGHGPESYYTI
ncbi:alpha/beta-hydrolase [Xylaria sp. FL1777]|nr:alpha/beta-hydrolase [Xylaria sp. FL1777]